jgi:hypothetical protein
MIDVGDDGNVAQVLARRGHGARSVLSSVYRRMPGRFGGQGSFGFPYLASIRRIDAAPQQKQSIIQCNTSATPQLF